MTSTPYIVTGWEITLFVAIILAIVVAVAIALNCIIFAIVLTYSKCKDLIQYVYSKWKGRGRDDNRTAQMQELEMDDPC